MRPASVAASPQATSASDSAAAAADASWASRWAVSPATAAGLRPRDRLGQAPDRRADVRADCALRVDRRQSVELVDLALERGAARATTPTTVSRAVASLVASASASACSDEPPRDPHPSRRRTPSRGSRSGRSPRAPCPGPARRPSHAIRSNRPRSSRSARIRPPGLRVAGQELGEAALGQQDGPGEAGVVEPDQPLDRRVGVADPVGALAGLAPAGFGRPGRPARRGPSSWRRRSRSGRPGNGSPPASNSRTTAARG